LRKLIKFLKLGKDWGSCFEDSRIQKLRFWKKSKSSLQFLEQFSISKFEESLIFSWVEFHLQNDTLFCQSFQWIENILRLANFCHFVLFQSFLSFDLHLFPQHELVLQGKSLSRLATDSPQIGWKKNDFFSRSITSYQKIVIFLLLIIFFIFYSKNYRFCSSISGKFSPSVV